MNRFEKSCTEQKSKPNKRKHISIELLKLLSKKHDLEQTAFIEIAKIDIENASVNEQWLHGKQSMKSVAEKVVWCYISINRPKHTTHGVKIALKHETGRRLLVLTSVSLTTPATNTKDTEVKTKRQQPVPRLNTILTPCAARPGPLIEI